MIDKNGDYYCRNSRKIYLGIYFLLVIPIALAILGYFYGMPPNKNFFIGLAIVLAIGIKATELHRIGHAYKITHDHLWHKKGVVSQNIKKVFLPTISDIDLIQTPWQRIMNYGDVVVYRYGETGIIKIKNIDKPKRFVDFLQQKMSCHELG